MTEEAQGTQSVEPMESEKPQMAKSYADMVLADQGLTEISEADLMGEMEDEEESTEAEAKAKVDTEEDNTEEAEETEEEDDIDADEETEDEDESEAKQTEPPPPKTEPPPKGFVPIAALREAREENKALKAKLQQLEQQQPKEPDVKIPKVREDFKVLSKEEFKELAEESPQDALTYLVELEEYKEAKRLQAEQAAREAAKRQEVERLLSEAAAQMVEVIPDLFEEKSASRKELAEFAESIGFTKDMFYLTNPETQVILPGETTPLYLGTQAASIIKMLATLKRTLKGSTSQEQELRKKIEAEVLTKVKSSGKQGFKSIADIPTSKSSAPLGNKVLTEQEVAKLSPKELEAYLSGKL